jgi:hypothetical protein
MMVEIATTLLSLRHLTAEGSYLRQHTDAERQQGDRF